ncbi:hypothetical protein LWI28_004308 [Acer negundo]|uniref:Secreted protein n=1 Tax=Acer negundo TaxID=4023 RepID=A0AAD5IFG3_ACENE|nr:hypothetical protein LWI28_004308 [Acer negundo]
MCLRLLLLASKLLWNSFESSLNKDMLCLFKLPYHVRASSERVKGKTLHLTASDTFCIFIHSSGRNGSDLGYLQASLGVLRRPLDLPKYFFWYPYPDDVIPPYDPVGGGASSEEPLVRISRHALPGYG